MDGLTTHGRVRGQKLFPHRVGAAHRSTMAEGAPHRRTTGSSVGPPHQRCRVLTMFLDLICAPELAVRRRGENLRAGRSTAGTRPSLM